MRRRAHTTPRPSDSVGSRRPGAPASRRRGQPWRWRILAILLLASSALGEPSEPKVRLETVRLEGDQSVATLESGETAQLTLRSDLQRASEQLLIGARPLAGAAILVDVETGKLLAMASYRRAGAPPGNPLTTGAPSASVFKLVTTVALFEHTHVAPNTRVCFDGGEHSIERRHLERPPPQDARCGPFFSALGYSRNAVYAQLATQHLMRNELLETAERFGFNQPLPFDADATLGEIKLPYNDLQFARAAAGFQGSTLTPLGAAQLAYSIAVGGRSPRMRLIESAGDFHPPEERTFYGRIMTPNAAWRLSRMMEVTVHSGTSLGAFTNEAGMSYLGTIRVAGKTGTLQRRETSPTTSWFTGFAPSRDPKVVVTVLLQNGSVWRRRANEVARDLLRTYFADHPGVTLPE